MRRERSGARRESSGSRPLAPPESMRDRHADGLLVVVDDVDAECARLQREGVAITTQLQTEPWGERFFQVSDPNGVIVEFVQWVTAPTG
jgi:predicted enzyme related to lactoylglutathione lyase